MKKESRGLAEEISRLTMTVEEKKAVLGETTSELERKAQEYALSVERGRALQTDLNDLLYQKQLNQERIAYKKKYAKRLKDLSQQRVDPSASLQVERKLLASSQALDNVKEIIFSLKEQHPHLTEVLDRVAAMADSQIVSTVDGDRQTTMDMQ